MSQRKEIEGQERTYERQIRVQGLATGKQLEESEENCWVEGFLNREQKAKRTMRQAHCLCFEQEEESGESD